MKIRKEFLFEEKQALRIKQLAKKFGMHEGELARRVFSVFLGMDKQLIVDVLKK